MKKTVIAVAMVFLMVLGMTACGGGTASNSEAGDQAKVTIKSSPDKYTFYVKNYVGMNLASIGYTSIGGDRNDTYGEGYIKLVLVSPDGEYINIEKDEALKNYKVVAQNPKPNTEIKYIFDKDEDTGEDGYFVEWQNVSEVVLTLAKAGGIGGSTKSPTAIKVSPDVNTAYVKDYVGRNLTMCGYISLGGDMLDNYGYANVKLTPNASTGEYIDVNDEKALKQYVVVGQNVEPNSEMKIETDEYGFASYQTYEEIVLDVQKIEN